VNEEALALARRMLSNKALARRMANHNYALARKHYSYSVLKDRLSHVMGLCFGS